MQRIIWDRATDASPAVEENVFNMLVEREIARDRAERRTNPWLAFMSEFFAECKASNSKPWKNTGMRPMSFASQVYQEHRTIQEAFQDNGMWDSEKDQDTVHVNPEELCEDDLEFWHDRMGQANIDDAKRERNLITLNPLAPVLLTLAA